MLKIAQLLTLACFLGCCVTAWPLLAQETTTDAIQNIKLLRVEEIVVRHDHLIAAINEKMTYTQGGVAGIYALLGIIGLFNLKLIQKKQ